MRQLVSKQHRSRGRHRGVHRQVCRVVIHRDVRPAGGQARTAAQKQPNILSGLALFLTLLLPAISQAAVTGKVVNRTTGQPAGGILVTLLKFEAGMDPIEEVRTDAGGSFTFQKPLVGANGSAVPGMVRTEFEGVSYSEMIPPGRSPEGLEIPVYSVEDKQSLAPRGHILIFEPGTGEMVVNENFAFLNESSPPRTFRDAENGSLRFYLPPAAKGIVQVRAAGPQRMPLRSVATPTGEENIYKVDFPLKPGENSIDLTYLVPFSDGTEFEGRVLYDGLDARIAAPAGVSLEGAGLVSLGEEPRTKASIFEFPAAKTLRVKISGQGQLAGSRGVSDSASASGGGSEIQVTHAPVAKELYWILGLTAAVLAVGFFYLYTAGQPGPAAAMAASDAAAPSAEARRASPQAAQRRATAQRKS
jgi:hypothetical protein